MRKVLSLFVAFCLVLSLCSGIISPVPNARAASPWYVDPLGTDDAFHGAANGAGAFKTIQYAITAAASGDTVNVAAGTYTENVTIPKSLTLQGEVGSIISVADGPAVTITVDTVTTDGFGITHSSGPDDLLDVGILLNQADHCMIAHNNIYLNAVGIEVLDSAHNTIHGNTMTTNVVGLYFEGTTESTTDGSNANAVTGNTISASFKYGTDHGNGIYLDAACNSNTFTGNELTGNAGDGIYSWKASYNTYTSNTITSNGGAGIQLFGSSNNTITGNTITGNYDGLYIRNINESLNPPYSIRNNVINRNKIHDNTRVNLYADPNFWFDVTGNWWGSDDQATIVSKIASWVSDEPPGGVVTPGTTVFISYWPWYVDEAMTTLSTPGTANTLFDHSSYACRAGQSLSITSTTTYGDMSGADPAARVDALVTLSHAFTSDVIIHANAGATPLGIDYTLPAGQASFWISYLVPDVIERPLLTGESGRTEPFTLIIDSVPEGAAGTTTVTAQVVATSGSFVTPPASADILSTGSATLDVAVATLSLVPASGTTKWANGDTFDLMLQVHVDGAGVNALDTTITFDPTHLQVTGVDWATGNPFEQEIEKTINNTTGSVIIANGHAATLVGPGSTTADVAVIHFQTKDAGTGVAVGFAAGQSHLVGPGTTLVDPVDYLTGTHGATVTINDIQVTATGDHATYAPNPDIVEYNGTASFTVTPAAGYYLASVDHGTFVYDGLTSTYTWTIPNVTGTTTVTATLLPLNVVYVAKTGSDTLNDGHDAAHPVLTIGRGVSLVAANGTVHVAAGTYTEHVTITKSLSLIGAGASTTTIDGSSTGIVVTVGASNVTVSGFTVQHSGMDPLTGAGIGLTSSSGCTVSDNTITASASGVALLFANGNFITGNTVTDNIFGIAVVAGTGNTISSNTVSGNLLDAIAFENAAFVGGPIETGSTGNFIKGNTISSNRDGIFLGQNCDANQITDGNQITHAAAKGINLWLAGTQTITGNTISGSAIGIGLLGSSDNIITNNSVTGNTTGFEVRAAYGQVEGACLNNTINHNNISGNTAYGMDVVATEGEPLPNEGAVVIATNNWWGAESGPLDGKTLPGTPNYNNVSGAGNMVSPYVDYKPFLMDGAMTIDSTITVNVVMIHGTHNATVPVTVQYGNTLVLTATPTTYYYVYSTTRGTTTTVLPFTNRMLGLPQALTFENITATLSDSRTTTVAINIFRRGDIAGNSGPDGTVGIVDLGTLIAEWRKTTTDIPQLLADLNCDLSVNISDLSMMMSLWGNP